MNLALLEMAKQISKLQEELEEFVGGLPLVEFQNKKQIAQGYLTFDTMKDLADAVVKLARKGREHCAQELLEEMKLDEITSIETAGKKFTRMVKGYFNRPSKSKKREQYDEFMAWMRKDKEGKEFLKDSIEGKAFGKWCQERLTQGKELPLNVTVHSEPTVKVRASRA